MLIHNKRDGVIRSNSEISRLIKSSGKGQYDDSCEHENESGDHIIRSGKEVVQNICPHISKNANTSADCGGYADDYRLYNYRYRKSLWVWTHELLFQGVSRDVRSDAKGV